MIVKYQGRRGIKQDRKILYLYIQGKIEDSTLPLNCIVKKRKDPIFK